MKIRLLYTLILFLTICVFGCKEDKRENTETNKVADVENTGDHNNKPFVIQPKEARLLWEGYKPTATHKGSINLSSGEIRMENGSVIGGAFVIDMNTVVVTDLEGEEKTRLEKHLMGTAEGKEDDFFNVKQYPTANFEITKVVKLDNDESANHMIYGNLTICDQTNQIGFKSNIIIEERRIKVFVPQFNIDRTKWGLKYKSKNFSDLKDKFINDEIGLMIYMVGYR